MSRLLTASKSHLAMFHCNAFLEDAAVWDESSGLSAKVGNEMHAMIDAHLKGNKLPPGCPKATRLFNLWLTWWKVPENKTAPIASEIAIAYDIANDTARILKTSGPRDYSDAKPGEMTMSLDMVYQAEDADGNYIHCDDWKSGRPVTPARENGQLATAACALAALHGIDRVRVGLVYLTEHRSDSHSVDDSDFAWLDALEHQMTRAKLRRAVKAGPPNPGEHCYTQWCPARNSCPVSTARKSA